MTFGAHVGLYGAAWKGLLLRPTITGHTEMKSLLEQAFMAIWGNTVHYNINTSTFSWNSRRNFEARTLRRTIGLLHLDWTILALDWVGRIDAISER